MKTPKKKTAENFIKDIRRNTRRIFSSEQKIQIAANDLYGFYDWDSGFCGGFCVGFSECDGVMI